MPTRPDKSGKPKMPASESSKNDTGVRGTYSGSLYLDKDVFFRRSEVKAAIEDLRKSIKGFKPK